MSDVPDTVKGLLSAYRRAELTPLEVVDYHLTQIGRIDPKINAFAAVDRDAVRAAAQQSTNRWQRGERTGDLDGVPITVKDIVAMSGLPTREGSRVTSELKALVDAPVVARLRDAGALLLGKTTTPEFGWKGITDSPACGITRNPWNLDYSPGGSSGGAAAALSAGIGVAAHGNDGGGSIRIPASYCGLVGLKPTHGRVPQAPVESPYSSLVANGPMTRTVEDAALLLNVMSRPDIRDWHALPYDPRDWRVGLNDSLRDLKIAYSDRLGGAEVDQEVGRICRAAIDRVAIDGTDVIELDEIIEPLRPQFEKYWKAGFAHRLRSIPPERRNDLDPEYRKLAEEGLDVGVEALDAAHAARARLVARMRRLHLDYDLLLTPTMPTTAPPAHITYHSTEFDRWQHAVPFTLPFNLTGQPAASIPVGVTGVGLPVGLQVIATHHREDLILRSARTILDLLGWAWPDPNLARRIAVLQA
ncbi:MAG: amidase [Acidimicrobiia bacterium]|nr:amidase [Acidimicrobiia bacterium]